MTERAEARRFAGNAMWLLVGDAVSKLASFAFLVIVARALPRVEFGYFTFALSFIPLFLVLSAWGLDDALFREVARSRERVSELFASTFIPRAGLATAALLVSIGIGRLFVPGTEAFLAFVIVGVSLLIDELGSAVGTVFKAFEQMRYRAIRIMVNRFVTTILAIVALLVGADLLVICLMYLAGSVGSFLFAWYALRRHFPPIDFSDRKRELVRELLGKGLPLGLSAVLGAAALRIDTVMLQGIKGATAVALYGVAFRFLDSFLFVAWGLANVALPRMARDEKGPGAARTFELVLALCLAFYLPMAVGAAFAGEWIVTTVFGDKYSAAGVAVFWLATAGVFYAVGYLARMGCLGLGRRKAIAWAALIAVVVNVPLNLIVIPRYGFEGAAVVTLVTGAVEAAILTGVFVTGNRAVRLRGAIFVPILAAAAMGLVLGLAGLEDLVAVAVGSAVYVASVLVLAPLLARRETALALRALRRSAPSAA